MSSRTRKLAKRIELTQVSASTVVHGCEHCRSLAQRQSLTRGILALHGTGPVHATCPQCSAKWRVSFGGDRDGNALVRFDAVVLS